MSFVAVAIGGSALVGAGASILSAGSAASAERSATAASTALQQQQIAETTREYDQNRTDLAPYRDAGTVALGQVGKGTAEGGEFNRAYTPADFAADPSYEFRRSEGQRGVEASAAARGQVLSGGTLKALTRYNQNFATTDYAAAEARNQNDVTSRFNRLASVAGIGQTATNATIAAGENANAANAASTNNIINNIQGAANATASSYVAAGNAVGGAANNVGQYFSLKNLIGGGSAYGASFQNQPYTPPANGSYNTAADYGF